jgi:adenosine deaminase
MSQSASSSSSSSSQRHSTRARLSPLTLEHEEAARTFSQLEERDLAAAMSLSLASSWQRGDEKEVEVAVSNEEASDEEKEELYLTPATVREEDEWTDKITAVDIPLPRLRT